MDNIPSDGAFFEGQCSLVLLLSSFPLYSFLPRWFFLSRAEMTVGAQGSVVSPPSPAPAEVDFSNFKRTTNT